MNKKTTATEDFQLTARLQSHISEYEQTRDEINLATNSQQQTLVLILASASVAIPLILGMMDSSTSSLPAFALPVICFLLSIIFSVITMNYSTTMYTIAVAGRYLQEFIEPAANELIGAEIGKQILHFGTYKREYRRNFITVFLASAGPAASVFTCLAPSLALLKIGDLVAKVPYDSLLITFRGFAWLCFAIAALSIIAGLILTIKYLK